MSEGPADQSETRRQLLAKLLAQKAAEARTYPASFAQRRLWFLDRLEPGSAAYNVPLTLRLRGPLEVPLLERTLAEIVRRHEPLRTRLAEREGEPVQVVDAPRPVSLAVEDVPGETEAERRAAAERLAGEALRLPFDLARGPLLRVRLFRVGAGEHLLALAMHHAVVDGWSIGVLSRELTEVYHALAAGKAPALAPLAVQYGDYAAWQRRHLEGPETARQLAWWRERLAGAPPVLELPGDRPRPADDPRTAAVHRFVARPELHEAVTALARREGATLFMTVLAAFGAVLARWSGEDDLVVGTPVAGRTRPELEPLVGYFVNTLALRVDASGEPTFGELLARVRAVALGAFAHQDVPFEKLVEELKVERSLSHTPVYQVMLTVHNAPVEAVELPGLEVRALALDSGVSLFDLMLTVAERDGGLQFKVEYSTSLFDAATIGRFGRWLERMLEGAAADPGLPVASYPLLDEEERLQVVEGFNATAAPRPAGECVHHLFRAQAVRTPDAEAVRFGRRSTTYAELDAASARLAGWLRARGAGPDVPVAICLERGTDAAVAVLAVLRAGAAYVALDPAYPRERLAYMLRDSGAPVLVTSAALAESVDGYAGRVVRVDADAAAISASPPFGGGDGAAPENAAYVLYTSGSTGTPKGVVLPHRALVNLLRWQLGRPGGGALRTLQLAPLSFDVSFQEMFATWCACGTLVLVDDETRRDPARLLDYVAREGVERLFLPFVALQQLAEVAEERGDRLPALRWVATAGEQLQATAALRAFFARHPEARLENQYGPTETHVASACALPADPAEWAALPPVGAPVENARLYVLDSALAPVPVGVPGELYVGGVGIARGYLERPGLTAERFVPDPFSAEPGARIYRTGDLASWLETGGVQFRGRADHQVKVRGYRVEPGEIEAALLAHPALREAVVAVRGAGAQARLAAYFVASGDAPGAAELREMLRETLPEHMVPSAFVALDALPRTPSGKVDRRALPEPGAAGGEREPVAPRTPTEERMAEIWAEVLGIPAAGVEDDFFDLGGHSLLATRVTSHARAAFGVEMPLRRVFETPTIAGLARWVEGERERGAEASAPISRAERRAVSLGSLGA